MAGKDLPHISEKSLLLLLAIISLFPPIIIGFSSTPYYGDLDRGNVIAPAYIAVCILGVAAAFYPGACSRPMNSLRHKEDTGLDRGLPSFPQDSKTLLSHHPPCDGLQFHEFKLAGRRFCAGCTGMTAGAAASSLLVVSHFSQNWLLPGIANGILAFGVLLVALGLIQTLFFDIEWQIARFFLNVLFVLGVSLILIGEDMLRRSLLVDAYILVLALFWLYIRIRSSHLSHETICAECNLICPLDEPFPNDERSA